MGILDHAIAGASCCSVRPVLGTHHPIDGLCGFCWGLRRGQRRLAADGDGNLPAYFDFDLWFLR